MRVLVTSTPGVGHIHPVVPIADALAGAGHDVTWATAPDGAERVRAQGHRAVAAGIAVLPRNAAARDAHPELLDVPPRARRPLTFQALFAEVAGPAMLADLAPIIDDIAPDLLVTEPAELAGPALAAARGVPRVVVGFGGAIPPAVLDAAGPGIDALWTAVGLRPPPDAGLYDDRYLHPLPDVLSGRPAASTVRPVRPLAVDGPIPSPPPWLAGLGEQRPLVYVTFGTEMGVLAPWAAVFDALAGLDVDAVATVGAAIDPSSVPAPPNVRVERYVSQRFVLERAAVVVSQAGSGVMIGAARHGVPQVCVPLGADQFDNADALAASGAGLTVEPDDRSAERIRSAVETALAEPAIARAARSLAAAFELLPDPSALVPDLEDLAAARRR